MWRFLIISHPYQNKISVADIAWKKGKHWHLVDTPRHFQYPLYWHLHFLPTFDYTVCIKGIHRNNIKLNNKRTFVKNTYLILLLQKQNINQSLRPEYHSTVWSYCSTEQLHQITIITAKGRSCHFDSLHDQFCLLPRFISFVHRLDSFKPFGHLFNHPSIHPSLTATDKRPSGK